MRIDLGHCLVAAAALSTLWIGVVRAEDVPAVTVPPCRTPPRIDAVLDDACWPDAAVLAAFHRVPASDSDDANTTRVRVTRDAAWLYLAVECDNPEMPSLADPCPEHDGLINRDDSVEVFLDPGTEGNGYFHYLFSYANVRAERRVVNGTRDTGWNIPWRSATQRDARGWRAELGLPLCVLDQGDGLADLRMNVARNLETFGVDGIGERTVSTRRHYSWAPVANSFHEPARFGRLLGLEGLTVGTPFLPAIEHALAGEYAVTAQATTYTVSGKLRAYSTVTGVVAVVVVDHPAGGEAREHRWHYRIGGKRTSSFAMDIPVATVVERAVTVQIQDPKTGEVWQSYPILDTSGLTLMDAPLPDRDYYTDEAQAHIRFRIRMTPQALAGFRLTMRDSAGRVSAETTRVLPETVLALPLGDVPNGVHAVQVQLVRPDATTAADYRLDIAKKAPRNTGEVKIDRWNRAVLKDGLPFFPFGVLFNSYGDMEWHVRHLAEAGMNTLVWWGGWSSTDPLVRVRFLDLARKYGLSALDTATYYVREGERFTAHAATVAQRVKEVRDHPALLAYYSLDEPNLVARHRGGFESVAEDCRVICETVRALDGYHPVFMLYAREVPPHPQATAWSDILGYDVYLTGGMDGFYATPNFMAGYTTFLDRRAARAGQSVWMVPLAEQLDPKRTFRGLLPEEHRCQAYLAVIHGARGLLYFMYQRISHRLTWEALSSLAQEFRELAPVVLNRRPVHTVSYEPGLYAPENNRYPAVQAALFRDPEGEYVLLAANSCTHPVDVACTVPGLADGDSARIMFTDRVLEVQDASFRDRLEWYDTRAYTFSLPDDAGDATPIAVRITTQAFPDQAHVLPRGNPKQKAQNLKNWIPNPSLERQTMPGLPDGVTPYRVSRPAIDEPGCLWAVDEQNPFHGRYSVRMTRDMDRCWGMFFAGYPPNPEVETPYVLSMYLRGGREGDKASVMMIEDAGDRSTCRTVKRGFALTRDWKRYTLPFSTSTGPIPWMRARTFLVYPHEGATVWIDALQMEQGTEPTPFR